MFAIVISQIILLVLLVVIGCLAVGWIVRRLLRPSKIASEVDVRRIVDQRDAARADFGSDRMDDSDDDLDSGRPKLPR